MEWITEERYQVDDITPTGVMDVILGFDQSNNIFWTPAGTAKWRPRATQLGIAIKNIRSLEDFYSLHNCFTEMQWSRQALAEKKCIAEANTHRERLECELVQALYANDDALASKLITQCKRIDNSALRIVGR